MLIALLLIMGTSVSTLAIPRTHTVTVKADGSFAPQHLLIHQGDTVMWQLNNATDAIIPVDTAGTQDICSAYKPYHPKGMNEFTGPMPRAASGIFVLGPMGKKSMWPGFKEEVGKTACRHCEQDGTLQALIGDDSTTPQDETQCLCETGMPYATMEETWADPDITGVFIRLDWNAVHKGPGQFEWEALDWEIQQAVDHGKLYSLVFRAGERGTPGWIFNPSLLPRAVPSMAGQASRVEIALPQVVKRLHFQDGSSKLEQDKCGPEEGMDLGSPADATYRKYYFELLRAAAAHLKEKNAWYRALAYIKPSGMNLFTDENRLPNRCTPGCLCNTEVWAAKGKGDYTPTALKNFYTEQMQLLADEFPDKDMSYMLIQAGFPLVNEAGEYLGQPGVEAWTKGPVLADKCIFPNPDKVKDDKGKLPYGTQQTECILQVGKEKHGLRFAVQHNGLGPLCDDIPEDADNLDECLPNKWAKNAGKDGHIIGYQTNNADKVGSREQLEAAFQNGYCNSNETATFFEIYEQRLWEVRQRSRQGVLDPNAGSSLGTCKFTPSSNRTLRDWADMLHAWRNSDEHPVGPSEPFPAVKHEHTFKRTINASVQAFTYVHGSKCHAGKAGVVTVVPDITTRGDTSSQTHVAGYDHLGPAHKPTPATVHSLPAVTPNRVIALRGISLAEATNASCALSLSFQALPGQTEKDTSLGVDASLSGPPTCQSPTQLGLAKFDDGQHFVHGIRVCTSGPIPRVKGIEIYATKVNEDGTISGQGVSERFVASGCSAWSPTRFCPAGKVAVGVLSYFTDGGGFSGLALQCMALQAL
jgi:hypothetical protein